jgi:hypothetical protein
VRGCGAWGKSPIEIGCAWWKGQGIMKVLLRDLRAGLYFGGEMKWVEKPKAAADFATLEAASRRAGESGGADVAVVLRYDGPECELALNPADCLNGGGGVGQRLQA